MGVDTTFYACLGVYVSKKTLMNGAEPEIEMVPSCSHSPKERAGKFCTSCGVRVSSNEQEVTSDDEENMEMYFQKTSGNTTVQDPKTGRDDGYLIGDLRNMDRDSRNNRGTIMVNPEKIDAVVNKINKILEDAPNGITYRVKPEDISVHYYMDQR